MSRLDGNERWKSKMLLTEHVERYDEHHADGDAQGAVSAVQERAPRERNIITTEERAMLRDFILLPHMEKMVEKSIADVENGTNILRRAHLMAGQKILDRIVKDLYGLRRELKQRNIRILNEEHADLVVYHRYFCRGYEDRFGMTRDVMRSEISVRLARYTSELAALLKEGAMK
ncbi:hypothetical protein GZH47_03120 [Paenibacillus rhizovicinus]|uniref:Uncharacterized protein n=1 Tax=Paenibacillus rhizovicinus TaxID=2704463 RepID=A0A6C0NUN6_9BACL|nr:hypothetical protein [Paenibacillus rhizovicinus]QHW29924.1 hypothetical protein GZH47_03120 [Paenibacillus rhizovicinus]